MVKYDKFELYMVNSLWNLGQKIDSEDNRVEVEVFTNLMETLYQYEKLKDCGDIITD